MSYPEIIVQNSARCLICRDEIVSTHRHHFELCTCGRLAVDGGDEYLRRVSAKDARWVDTSILAEQPANREQLIEARELLAFVKVGARPPDTDWSDAPVLDDWRIVQARVPPAAEGMQELEGAVTGHPDFQNGQRIRTTPLLFAPNGKSWARTMTRYFRLGTPAKGDLN